MNQTLITTEATNFLINQQAVIGIYLFPLIICDISGKSLHLQRFV